MDYFFLSTVDLVSWLFVGGLAWRPKVGGTGLFLTSDLVVVKNKRGRFYSVLGLWVKPWKLAVSFQT